MTAWIDEAAHAASVAFAGICLALAAAYLIVAGWLLCRTLDGPIDAACRWTEALYQKKAKR